MVDLVLLFTGGLGDLEGKRVHYLKLLKNIWRDMWKDRKDNEQTTITQTIRYYIQ